MLSARKPSRVVLSNQSFRYLFWLAMSKVILTSFHQWVRVVKERHRKEMSKQPNICTGNTSKSCSKMLLFFPSAARAALSSCVQVTCKGTFKQKECVFDLHLPGRRKTEQLSVYHVDLISITLNHSFGKHENRNESLFFLRCS